MAGLAELVDFEIKVDGVKISDDNAKKVLEIVVDSSTHLPAMCTIRLHDPDMTLMDGVTFDIGCALDVNLEGVERFGDNSTVNTLELLFKGEITALEPDFGKSTILLVRAYDKSHRLHRGRKTRTFAEQKDSDMASTVAGEAGLTAQVDATTITYPYVLQNNQTNMEFLLGRARRIGYQVYSYNGNLYFKKGSWVQKTTAFELNMGTNLLSFRPRATAVQQHDAASAYGWDVKTKAAITGAAAAATVTNLGGLTQTGGALASSKFGGSVQADVVNIPVGSVDEAISLAQAVEDAINSEYLQAEGSCLGSAKVMAGSLVKIVGAGTKFSGNYYVTQAMHRWTTGGVYMTQFGITGRQPNTFSSLVQQGGDLQGHARGVVIGLVTNLSDPDDFGRVKVKFPWMPKASGADIESTWCRIASPMAGASRGMYFLPEIGDEVLVAFDHDDLAYPYIIGGLWNKTDKPPLAAADAVASGKVKQRIIKSTSGHVIILDDTSGAEKITIKDKTTKNEFSIDCASNTITIITEDKLTVTAKGAVSIKSSGGDMTLEAKNINMKATQNVKMEATSSLSLKAMSSCTMEGTAGVTIKNAAAEIALSGPSINMNKGALEVM
jgi:phage protein D/phage baseplate assembly protein gpV